MVRQKRSKNNQIASKNSKKTKKGKELLNTRDLSAEKLKDTSSNLEIQENSEIIKKSEKKRGRKEKLIKTPTKISSSSKLKKQKNLKKEKVSKKETNSIKKIIRESLQVGVNESHQLIMDYLQKNSQHLKDDENIMDKNIYNIFTSIAKKAQKFTDQIMNEIEYALPQTPEKKVPRKKKIQKQKKTKKQKEISPSQTPQSEKPPKKLKRGRKGRKPKKIKKQEIESESQEFSNDETVQKQSEIEQKTDKSQTDIQEGKMSDMINVDNETHKTDENITEKFVEQQDYLEDQEEHEEQEEQEDQEEQEELEDQEEQEEQEQEEELEEQENLQQQNDNNKLLEEIKQF